MEPQQYQELLDLLDEDPQRLHDLRVRLLTPDLITLPEQFAKMVATVNELLQFAKTTDRRLNSLDQHAIQADRHLASLNANVANLTGSDLERRVRNNIRNIARDHLGLTRSQIVLAEDRDANPRFLTLINAAEADGRITRQQADHVLEADIIIRARPTDEDHYVQAVLEISRTIRNDDIQRSHDRATTVATATGEPSIAAVIGQIIQPPQRQRAADLGVRVVTPVMFQQQPQHLTPDDPA